MATKPKFVQAVRMTLLAPISESEVSSILLDRFVDVYLNTLDPQVDFFGTVFLTINPGGDNEEIISFTNGTRNADGSYILNTGIIRHLAAKDPYDTSGTPQSHAGGEDVVVSNEPQFYKAITDYVDGLVLAPAVQATKTAFGYTKQTETNQNARVRAALVSQQASPGLTVAIAAFSISITDKTVIFTGGNSPAMTAPIGNPRVDLIVYDTTNTVIAVRTGATGASPSAPTPTTGDIVLASIFHRTGTTKILEQDDSTNSYVLRWYEPAIYRTDLVTSATFPVAPDVDQSQTTQNTTIAVGEADTSSKHNLVAQSFTPAYNSVRGFELYKAADTGSFIGTVTVSIQADSAGSPSGSNLSSVVITNAIWLTIPAGAFQIGFTADQAVTIGSLYWVVVTTSTSNTSNHPNVNYNSVGGYAAGSLKYKNTTDGWVAVAGADLYFKMLAGLFSKVPQTDATNGKLPLRASRYGLIDMDATGSSLGNSTVETTVYQKTLPAGTFLPNTGIKITLNYTAGLATTNNLPSIGVYLNGVGMLACLSVSGASTSVTYDIEYTLIFLNNGATNVQKYYQKITKMAETYAANLMASFTAASGTAAIDTSAGENVLRVTLTNAVNGAASSWTYQSLIVESIS